MWWSKSLAFICVFVYVHAQHGYKDGHGSYVTSYSSNIQRQEAGPSYGYASAPVVAKIAAPVITKVATPVVAKYVAPAAVYAKAPVHEDYYAPPKYEFHYEIADSHTGDKKSQHEIRDGDVTKGEYSFVEADGTVRTVHYVVDGHSGFNAVVERSGHASHPQTSPVKTVAAAPIIAASHDYYKY